MPTRVNTIGKTRVGGKLTSRCFPIGLAHAQYSFTKKTRDKSIQKDAFAFSYNQIQIMQEVTLEQ